MEEIVEICLNREYVELPKLENIPTSLEGRIVYGVLQNYVKHDLIDEWAKIPGDLRLLSFLIRECYGSVLNHLSIQDLLRNKNPSGLSENGFYLLCQEADALDLLTELIKFYEPFSHTGLIHLKYLENNKFNEYLDLSEKFKFTPNNTKWPKKLYRSRSEAYEYDALVVHELEITGVDYFRYDIATFRKLGKFPYPYLNLCHDIGLLGKAILYFDQLELHEKTIILNLIASKPFELDYFEQIQNKEMLDLLSQYFNLNHILEEITQFIVTLVSECSNIVIEYFLQKFPEKVVYVLKIQIIIRNVADQIKYFFDEEITQELIDDLVRKIVD